jgi:lipoprotein-anchoring transpeptidase ErfK/SrfK
MIRRAALTPLVVGMLTASLISAVVLQHHNNQISTTLSAEPAPQQQSIPEPPITMPPTPTVAPLPPTPPPIALPAPKPVVPKPLQAKNAPCVAVVRACVKLSTRQAWLLDGSGSVVYGPVPITSGKKGDKTPTGMHAVLWKDADHKSKEFDDAPMPWSVFFADGGIAFHTGSLRAQSSGCIHLSDSAARKFFSTLGVGDSVQVLK